MKKRKSILTSIANLANTTVLKSPKTRAMTVSRRTQQYKFPQTDEL